ncbi:MAG: zinc-ribbon domain-containing protein [Candidatus Helarchaeota archaeon]
MTQFILHITHLTKNPLTSLPPPPPLKYCHNCGRKLLINELFCYYCGKKQWLF